MARQMCRLATGSTSHLRGNRMQSKRFRDASVKIQKSWIGAHLLSANDVVRKIQGGQGLHEPPFDVRVPGQFNEKSCQGSRSSFSASEQDFRHLVDNVSDIHLDTVVWPQAFVNHVLQEVRSLTSQGSRSDLHRRLDGLAGV